jgi:hypothetical protein
MVDMSAFHSVTIELHGGALTLAAICIAIKVVDMFWNRILGDRGGRFRRGLKKASEYSTPTILLASIFGVVGLVLSGITGSYLIPVETAAKSPIALNKIMIAIFATEFWTVMIATNLIFWEEAWKKRQTAAVMVVSGGVGYVFSVVGGSIGGTMAGKVSILEPVWETLGVDLHSSWILSSEILYALAAVVTIVGALLVVYSVKLAEMVGSVRRVTE